MLTPLATDIWFSDGPAVVGAAGFRFPTRMVLIRLPDDGGLWVWSPVALTDDLRAAVDQLGVVRHVVAPNHLHYTFLADWACAFPDARIYGAPGLSPEVAGATIHSTIQDEPIRAWSGAIDHVVVRGNRITTEVVFFHRATSTTLVTDLVQQIPRGWFKGWRAAVAKLDLMTAPTPSVPRKFRLATTDRPAFRTAIRRILEWPTEKLIIAHGAPVKRDGKDVLHNAFDWLVSPKA